MTENCSCWVQSFPVADLQWTDIETLQWNHPCWRMLANIPFDVLYNERNQRNSGRNRNIIRTICPLCKIGKHWEPATISSIFIKSLYNQTQAAQNCLLTTQTLFLARTGQIKVPGQAQVQILITDLILEKSLSKHDITGQIGSKAVYSPPRHCSLPEQVRSRCLVKPKSKSLSLTSYWRSPYWSMI